MTRLASLLKLLLLLAALSFLKADDNCQPVSQAVNNECDVDGYDCVKPENDKITEFSCPEPYRKEIKMDRRAPNLLHAEWKYQNKEIECKGDEWKAKKDTGTEYREGRVLGIRCTRKKVVYDTSCDAYEECRKPNINYPTPKGIEMNCNFDATSDPSQAYALQIRKGDEKWASLAKTDAESSEFLLSKSTDEDTAYKFRCARLKCYFSCHKDACTGLPCDNSKRFVRLSDDPKYNPQCVVKNTEGVSKWKTDTGLERELSDNSICEVLCSVVTPMKSICIDGYRLCEKVEFNDFAPAKCNGTFMYTTPKAEGPLIGNDFKCDRNSGKWYFKLMNDEYHELVSGGNVVCMHNDCNESKLFPACEEGENCKQVIRNRDRFECPKSTSVWTRPNATADWEKHSGTDYLMCKKGKMLENGQDPLAPGAQLRCKGQCSWSTNYIIMGVICLLAIR